jgi:hypothetical protein
MAIRGDDPLKSRAGHVDFGTTQGYIREAEAVRAGFGDVFPPLPASLAVDVEDKECPETSRVSGNRLKSRKSWKSLWRRRESNPGPQGVRPAFVHVRSRRIPGG